MNLCRMGAGLLPHLRYLNLAHIYMNPMTVLIWRGMQEINYDFWLITGQL